MKKIYWVFVMMGINTACSKSSKEVDLENSISIKPVSEIVWRPLNPARGNKSPLAGNIWGNRNGTEPTGFLVKFVDGFSSPPHIHNVSYRAIVIKGLVHNDDQDAEEMWMSTGSFWTQPAGQSHITSAKGEENIAMVEIDKGPYLVKPTYDSFVNGEKPVNIDYSNLVWQNSSASELISISSETATELALLWQRGSSGGQLLKLPSDFHGELLSNSVGFQAVVIAGKPTYISGSGTDIQLKPGSSFSATGVSKLKLSSSGQEESLIYIRSRIE